MARSPLAPPRASPRPRPPATPRARGVEARGGTKAASRRRAPAPPAPPRRLGICSALIVVAFIALAARVGQLQLVSGAKYDRLAVEQTLRTVPLAAERGSVFDRNGRDLALSVERTTVYADPKFVDDPVAEAAKLAPILHVDERVLVARLSNKGTTAHPRRFAYLARTVGDDVAQAVQALNLPGIGFVPESARSYPAGTLAGAIVGHVGTEGTGLDGTEYLYNSMLAGQPGKLVVEQDPRGHDIPNTQQTRVDARRGTDVVLTLDEDMQWEAEYSLLDQVRNTQAKGGMAVVVDITNGDVMAMATVVGATKTSPARVARPGERNAPLTDLYEPGSTNKLITIAWALEHGLVGPDTKFVVPYRIVVDPQIPAYRDAEWHPTMHWTTADILRESSNVGTIEIAQKMRNQELYDGLRAFGFGRTTSIQWPGQPAGLLLSPKNYYASGKYSTAIGYGAAVTGVQVLDALTTIANGGVTRPPRLLDATIDARGIRHPVVEHDGRRVVSTNTALTMTRMLEGVVGGGTGACGSISGYTVAGKTGTAKKQLVGGGYSDQITRASFEGFAPADNPRFAAIVVLDEPAFQYQYGGASAAPVFSEIMQFALSQYRVAQTDPTSVQYRHAQAIAQNPCTVPHGDDLARNIAAHVAAAARPAGSGTGAPAPGGAPGAGVNTTDTLPPDPSKHP